MVTPHANAHFVQDFLIIGLKKKGLKSQFKKSYFVDLFDTSKILKIKNIFSHQIMSMYKKYSNSDITELFFTTQYYFIIYIIGIAFFAILYLVVFFFLAEGNFTFTYFEFYLESY